MAFDLDGAAAIGRMAAHPELFAGIEAEAAKLARTLLTRFLKDKSTTLATARAMAAALPDGTLAHVTDGMSDAEVAALAARFDRLNPAAKAADRQAKAALVGALIAGEAEPAAKAARGAKTPPPKRTPSKVLSSEAEAASKALNSRAMGARKAVRKPGA